MTHRAVLALLALLLPAGVGAQDPPSAAPDTAAADTAIPLPPIQVTVLRTPLLLSETPFAVTVEEPAASTGPGLTLAGALGGVPGLQVDNRYNFSQGDRIAVRGFGARAQFGVRGVKVLVDGIPATMPDGQTSLSHLDPTRVERAEVVRGPASSLWGNAAGGVIQLETASPAPEGREVSATVLAGSHGLMRYGVEGRWGGGPSESDHNESDHVSVFRLEGRDVPNAHTSGLISPVHPCPDHGGPRGPAAKRKTKTWSGVAGLVSASRLTYTGFREHAAADKRVASARADWRGARDALTVVAHGVAYEARNPGSLSTDLLAEDRTQAYGFNVTQATGEAARQAQLGVTWRHDFGPGPGDRGPRYSVTAPAGPSGPEPRAPSLEVTAWALTRDLDNPIPPVIIDLSRWAGGVRGSVRGALELGARSVDWVAGVDAEAQSDDRVNHENDAGDRGARVLDQAERVTSVAPFVELAVPVAGPVSALAGLRYDRYRFTADDRLVTAGDATTDASGFRVMDRLSPSLGVTAELGGASVYANVASSFETPTTTELVNRPGGGAGFNPELEPQRARSVEAGARVPVAGRARLHVAAYRIRIRDALIPFEVATDPGRTFFRNAGSAVHRGLELDAWAALPGGFSARIGYAWTDARFDDFVTADADHSGNRVPGVAPHRVTGALTWTGSGRVAVEARWTDAIPVNDANTATAPSHTVVDLRAASPALTMAGAAVELFGGIDNVLDTEYVASVVVNAFGGRYYEPGPGRAGYLGLRVRPWGR